MDVGREGFGEEELVVVVRCEAWESHVWERRGKLRARVFVSLQQDVTPPVLSKMYGGQFVSLTDTSCWYRVPTYAFGLKRERCAFR